MRIANALVYGSYWASVLAAPVSLDSTYPMNATGSNCIGINSLSPRCRPVEASHHREVFYVGGHYQLDPQTQLHVRVDQMYVEKLTPFHSPHRRNPLVFFHGGGYSGAVSYQSIVRKISILTHSTNDQPSGPRHFSKPPTAAQASLPISSNGAT